MTQVDETLVLWDNLMLRLDDYDRTFTRNKRNE